MWLTRWRKTLARRKHLPREMQIAIGVLSWIAIVLFVATPFLKTQYQTPGFFFASIFFVLFLMTAPIVALSEEAAFQRSCSFCVFGFGVVLLALAALLDSESIVVTMLGPASIVFIGLGVIIWSDAILMSCFQRDRSRSMISLISKVLALVTMTLGPLLIGPPVIYFLNR